MATYAKPIEAVLGKYIEFHGGVPASLRKALSKLSPENQALITRNLKYPIGCMDFVREKVKIKDRRVCDLTHFNAPQTKLKLFQVRAAENLTARATGYLEASPAAGKTLIVLFMMHKLRVRTLVITHRTELAKQFAKAAHEELRIIPGFIGEGDRIEGAKFTVATAQSLVRHPLKDNYGMIVFDEAHHIASDTFVEILSHYSARYKYGVTATLSRSDDRAKIFPFLLGKHTVKVTPSDALDLVNIPSVIIRNTGIASAIHEFCTEKCGLCNEKHLTVKCGQKYKQAFVYLSGWINRRERNDMIAQDAKVLFEQHLQPIGILTKRRAHAEAIARILRTLNLPVTTCIGKIKNAQLEYFRLMGGIIVGTQSLLSEGINIPELTIVQLAAPVGGKKPTMQIIGRLMRGDGQKYLIDYVDSDSLSTTLSYARKNTYRSVGAGILDEARLFPVEHAS